MCSTWRPATEDTVDHRFIYLRGRSWGWRKSWSPITHHSTSQPDTVTSIDDNNASFGPRIKKRPKSEVVE